jgi:phosphopantetheinyl transferase
MPLLSNTPAGGGSLSLWRLEEGVESLLSGWVLSPAERAFYETITHPRRQCEWLAARRMIREILGPEVSTAYDIEGRPVLVGHRGHIGISHSDKIVALYHAPEPCGVDVERCDRPFERTAARYATSDERALPGVSLSLIWCLKEAAYKYACTPGLDFLHDIRVETLDPHARTARIRLRDERTIPLCFAFFDGYCLAWTERDGALSSSAFHVAEIV